MEDKNKKNTKELIAIYVGKAKNYKMENLVVKGVVKDVFKHIQEKK